MYFDLSIGYEFWESLSMPDVFTVNVNLSRNRNFQSVERRMKMNILDDLGRYNDYEFIDSGIMTDAELELELEETCPYNPEKGHVPEYKFAMVNMNTRAIMGRIRLRVGLTKTMNTYGGHIGYEVDKLYRGHRYAARSCGLLIPLIQRLEIRPVVITCAPDNIPSARTIESLGSERVEIKNVETEPGVFRLMSIYYWYL
jgi:tagatose 1,6-diphosphate aldolase